MYPLKRTRQMIMTVDIYYVSNSDKHFAGIISFNSTDSWGRFYYYHPLTEKVLGKVESPSQMHCVAQTPEPTPLTTSFLFWKISRLLKTGKKSTKNPHTSFTQFHQLLIFCHICTTFRKFDINTFINTFYTFYIQSYILYSNFSNCPPKFLFS